MRRQLTLFLALTPLLPGCVEAELTSTSASESPFPLDGSTPEEHTPPPSECAPALELACGDVVVADTADWNSGASQSLDSYPVAVGDWSAPELVYSLLLPESGQAEARLVDPRPLELDHDLFVLDSLEGSCSADDATARGHHSLELQGTPGSRLLVVVDGYAGDSGPFTLAIDCEESEPSVCDSYESTEQESAPIQAAAPLPPAASERSWALPSAFTSWVPFEGSHGQPAQHEGIDAIHDDPAVESVPVRAAADGTVVYVRTGCPQSAVFERNLDLRECGSGWGNHAVVDHGDGLFTRYAHLEPGEVRVRVGDELSQGDILASMGNSGRSETRHLHMELGSSETSFESCAPARSFDAVHAPAPLGIHP